MALAAWLFLFAPAGAFQAALQPRNAAIAYHFGTVPFNPIRDIEAAQAILWGRDAENNIRADIPFW